MPKQPITVFYLGKKRGVHDSHYDEFIKDATNLEVTTIDPSIGYDAKLFLKRGEEKPPSWEAFLKPGFPRLSLPAARALSAVLILSKTHSGARHWFACSFGAGRHLLNTARIQRNFGLKATLNAIYANGNLEDDTRRIRSVTAKTVSQNTLHTKRQTDANSLFDVFGIDADADFLRNVSGKPCDESLGSIMTGADAVTLRIDGSIAWLGRLCLQMRELSAGDQYKEKFGWIDKVRFVTDKQLRKGVLDEVSSRIRSKNVEGLSLTIPEIIDWEDVHHLEASWLPCQELDEVSIAHLISFLEENGGLKDLEGVHLKDKYRLLAKDGTDQILGGGSLLNCIAGEIRFGGKTYILSDGEFFEIEPEFLTALNTEIGLIAESTVSMPQSLGNKKEEEYNEDAASSSDDYLLLDKQTVRITSKTSPIEICDVLTANKQMIHVKRKLSSSSLSHLFSQGFVSGDLLVSSEDYRKECVQKINAAAEKRKPGNEAYRNKFNFIEKDSVKPAEIEIVYAIVAKWNGRSLVESLPFFSKVNLRRLGRDLRKLGYSVKYLKIDVVDCIGD
jgi:uncharacterized protein (TIGR04141 family)